MLTKHYCLAYAPIPTIPSTYLSTQCSEMNIVLPLILDFYLCGPPRVSQSGVELEKFFEYDFMASKDAYGSYKTYGKVRLTFGPL